MFAAELGAIFAGGIGSDRVGSGSRSRPSLACNFDPPAEMTTWERSGRRLFDCVGDNKEGQMESGKGARVVGGVK